MSSAPDSPEYDGSDTVHLYDELAFQDVLPLSWRRLDAAPDRGTMAGYEERNLRLLSTCEAMDEHVPLEKAAVEAPYSAEVQRLDLKINLLLDMMGQLLAANRARPAPVSLRFNALGMVWKASGSLPQAGEQGVAEVFLRDCLAEPLRLAGRISSVSPDGTIKVKFPPMGEAVADLIEKLAFRRHRRQIAGTRQPRRGE